MLKHELMYVKPYGDDREILSFNIPSPYDALNILQGVFYSIDDINYFIEWLEIEIIAANIPDYSLENGIEFQPILFGSKKSKIAEIVDGKMVGGQEFDTQEFLDVCYAWRDFLNTKDLEKKYPDIFSNLSDYALVKSTHNSESQESYTIFHISNQSWVLVEDDYNELIQLILSKNVRVVNDESELKIKDFVRYVMKWDEATKSFIKIPAP
jgi:hypothetical protein